MGAHRLNVRTLLVAATVLTMAACGVSSDDGADGTSALTTPRPTADRPPSPEPEPTPTPQPPPTPTPTETAPVETTGAGQVQVGSAGAAAAVPAPAGEPFDIPLSTGVEWGVVGVAAHDTLNVRSGPGVGAPIVARLAPHAVGVGVTGAARLVGDDVWFEIETDAAVGWVHSHYVAPIAGTRDVTAEIVAANGPMAATTLGDLADRVVAARGGADSRTVVSAGPRVGDLGEITVDVLDLFDDSVRIERLAIFGHDEFGHGFELTSVESTLFCHATRAGVGDGGGLVRVDVCA